jgi:Recombination endonuclease VII
MVMESFIERYGLMKYNGRHPLKMGTCELCPPTAPPPPSQTVYDHCHQHGWIRGEVCISHNSRLTVPGSYQWGPDMIAFWNRCPECPRLSSVSNDSVTLYVYRNEHSDT